MTDGSTLTFGGHSIAAAKLASTVVPALTIEWHPDPSRVGEILPLVSEKVSLTRLEPPVFYRPGAPEHGDTLADPYLSRSSWVDFTLDADGGVEVQARAHQLEVDCKPISTSLHLPIARIAKGVVLSICRPFPRIVLCLHHVRFPIERGRKLGMVGDSDAIERVREQISGILDVPVPVLVRGQTGTGKELVARALAHEGATPRLPFVAVNLSTLPAETAASELFGHERGAFTGAVGSRQGLFVEADGGTLLLDEIALAPRDVQHKLLRAVEDREIRPVGSNRPRKVNVRIVAATDADLKREVDEGRFHEPLLHRLGFCVNLPSLRERREDVGALFVHFLRKHLTLAGEPDRLQADFSAEESWIPASFVARLATRLPQGNVRGLENVARQLVLANRGRSKARIDDEVERLLQDPSEVTAAEGASPAPPTPQHVPPGVRPPAELTSQDLERALADNNWVYAGAAKTLGISRTTFYQLVEREGLARTAETLGEDEARMVYADLAGDLDAMAARLRIPRYALSQRLRELGIIRGR